MSSLVRKCGAVFLAFLILCSGIPATAAENRGMDADDNNIYEVLARSNMRAEPSINGAWVMTIPQGAVVRCLGTDDTEFCEIVYEGVTGYIYSGCIRRMINVPSVAEEAAPAERSGSQMEPIVNEYNHSMILGSVTGLGGLTNAFSAEPTTAQAMEELRVEVLVNANLRDGPSIETRRLTTVPEGTKVTFLDEGENGFTHISYQGQTGYIYTKLLDLGDSMASDSGIASTVTTREMQNSGRGGRNNSGITLMAQRGILSNRDEISTSVSVEVEDVAAVSNMIEVQTIVASAAQAEAAVRTAGTVTGGMEYEIRSRANMRTSPSAEGGWITTLPAGADVISLGETAGGYTMVQYDGITGYVLEDVLVDKADISKLGAEPVLFTVTAYCSCKICCGNYSPEVTGREARTSTGAIPQQGRTIAVDPTVIPYGTSVHIDGMGDYIAEDCGGAVRQNHIDVYFETHEAALMFGTRRLYVTINN
ncbi:MAG: SH3 domain-containing protein [Lachnospiraceae bacterium]|nr:SH3 domain-containing protein [Lachnospiraceae bacterium]